MNKTFLLIVALLLCVSVARADDFNLYYGTTSTPSTNVKIGAASSIQKLVFKDGQMTIITQGGSETTIPVANIQRLFFSTDETVGIEEVKSQDSPAQYKESEVYDLTGRRINMAPDALPKGFYIIDGKKTLVK